MAPDDQTAATATAAPARAPHDDAAVGPPEEAGILATVSELIVAVIGEEYVLDLDITCATSFNDDLELESIEFVALSARLREHYGERVDFVAFLADKEVGEIIALTVGDVVSYIAASLRAGPPDGGAEPPPATGVGAGAADDGAAHD